MYQHHATFYQALKSTVMQHITLSLLSLTDPLGLQVIKL